MNGRSDMPTAPNHDYDRDRIEQGFDRLRRAGRILESIESAWLRILLVVFGVMLGARAGAAVTREWTGIITGAVVGIAAGVWLAKRKLVREHVLAADLPEVVPGLHAPHLPGVQEQFARARGRLSGLRRDNPSLRAQPTNRVPWRPLVSRLKQITPDL